MQRRAVDPSIISSILSCMYLEVLIFPVVMDGCESRTGRKQEREKIVAGKEFYKCHKTERVTNAPVSEKIPLSS